MSNDTELKRKLGSMLGASMLATTLGAIPASYDLVNLKFTSSQAFAEGGNSGSGNSGSGSGGESGGDSDSGSGGESGGDSDSGSGGESGGNSGSGSGGESGGNSGSGSGGESGGNSGSGSGGENAGKSGRSGSSGERGGRRKGKRYSTSRSIPARFGRVVRSKSSVRETEVKYSDGWSENIREGRYQLVNPKGRVVVSRRARRSDRSRLKTAARK